MKDFGDREKYRQRARRPRPERVGSTGERSTEVDDVFDLVPGIGNGYRWYDYPYRLLWWMASGWRAKVTRGRSQKWTVAGINYLHAFNDHDRNKAWSLKDRLHNVFVPADEHVNVAGIWVVELFPPTELPALEYALKANGWDRSRPHSNQDEGNQQALQKARSGNNLVWWRFVDVVRKGSKRFMPDGVREDLPEDFELIEISAVQIGTGLTALVAKFHLNTRAATSLDEEWHRQHEPVLLRSWRRRPRALDRHWGALREVQAERQRIHSSARQWLAERVPGHFAIHAKAHPLLDLLLFDQLDPTVAPEDPKNREDELEESDALRALGLSQPHSGMLISDDLPKLVLSRIDPRLHEAMGDNPTWTLWGRRSAVVEALGEDGLKYYGDDQNRAIAGRLVDNIYNFFVMLAVSEYLSVTEAQYAALRDSASTSHGKFKPKALRDLRRNFLTLSLNLTSVQRDTAAFWDRPWGWQGDAEFKFHPTPRELLRTKQSATAAAESMSFNNSLREAQKEWFARLIDADRDYRDILSTVASLGASADSYRVGRLALWVAVASLIAAVGAVVSTDAGPNSLLAHTWNLLRQLVNT